MNTFVVWHYQLILKNWLPEELEPPLKEMHLTEARGTCVTKIKKAFLKNGSPIPEFDTDEDRSYFRVSFRIHPFFESSKK